MGFNKGLVSRGKTIKILLIIPSLKFGGAERVAARLTKQWNKNHNVSIILFDGKNPTYEFSGQVYDINQPGGNKSILLKLKSFIIRIINIKRLIQHTKPNYIISFMESANFPSIIAASLTGRLDSLTVSIRNNPQIFPWIIRFFMFLTYRFPARVVGCSEGVALSLKKMGLSSNKLFVIPNPSAELSVICRNNHLLDKPYILAVGRLHYQKGFDRLLSAFSMIQNKNILLVILGEGLEKTALKNLALQLGIENNLIMPGTVNNPMPWYQNALCFVLSSRYEGWPNVIMEAMANGCPVISFNCKYGPSEIIEHGVSGLLINDGDIIGLARAIDQVIYDSAFQNTLVSNSYKRIKIFNINSISKQWLI